MQRSSYVHNFAAPLAVVLTLVQLSIDAQAARDVCVGRYQLVQQTKLHRQHTVRVSEIERTCVCVRARVRVCLFLHSFVHDA